MIGHGRIYAFLCIEYMPFGKTVILNILKTHREWPCPVHSLCLPSKWRQLSKKGFQEQWRKPLLSPWFVRDTDVPSHEKSSRSWVSSTTRHHPGWQDAIGRALGSSSSSSTICTFLTGEATFLPWASVCSSVKGSDRTVHYMLSN